MKTVLIVEDDPINARVFSKILSKRGGLNVKHTEDVEEVMQIAQSGAADIILMDVSLAHSVYRGKSVDGIKITQLLKADAQTSNLPLFWSQLTRWRAIAKTSSSRVVPMATSLNQLLTINSLLIKSWHCCQNQPKTFIP
jgi:CheY-like chemotaxis protein